MTQILLLIALAAIISAIGSDIWRKHGTGVTSNHPVLALSPDGGTLAMNSSFRPLFQRRHPIILKQTDRLYRPARLIESHDWVVSDVAWSADGSKLYSTSGDCTIRVWDAESGSELTRIDSYGLWNSCLAVSPDGRRVVTGGGAGKPTVRVWELDQQRVVARLHGHKQLVWAVAFSRDGNYLVSSCIDKELRIWDTATWELVNSIRLTSKPRHLLFTAAGQLVVRGRHQPTPTEPYEVCVSVLSMPSGNVLKEFPIYDTYATVSSIALSTDGRLLAAAHGGDRNKAHSAVTVWDFDSMRKLETLIVHDHGGSWINALEFSTNGETLYCGSDDGRVTAQSWRDGASTVVFTRPGWPWKLGLIAGLVWIAAWRMAPRLHRPR
jgi:WD40 repeat protein